MVAAEDRFYSKATSLCEEAMLALNTAVEEGRVADQWYRPLLVMVTVGGHSRTVELITATLTEMFWTRPVSMRAEQVQLPEWDFSSLETESWLVWPGLAWCLLGGRLVMDTLESEWERREELWNQRMRMSLVRSPT